MHNTNLSGRPGESRRKKKTRRLPARIESDLPNEGSGKFPNTQTHECDQEECHAYDRAGFCMSESFGGLSLIYVL